MAYPDDNPKPKKLRVLEALRQTIADISQAAGYKYYIQRAHLYQGAEVALGSAFPAAVLYPANVDRSTRRINCAATEHSLQVAINVLLRVNTGSTAWRDQLHWLVADVTKAIDDNVQLGGEAVYCQVESDQVYDLGEGETIAAAEVIVSILYRHATGNPSL